MQEKENDEKLDDVKSEVISSEDDVEGTKSEEIANEQKKSVEEIQEELSKEAGHYKSIAQRAQADLVNYRSRAAQELEETRRTTKFGIFTRFLNIVDDLSRAVDNVPDDANEDWEPGISFFLRNLENSFDLACVTKISSLCDGFAPHLPDALMF